MSSSYVRDMAKSWTAGLVTPYIDVENREEDPNLPWLSLEFNSEYVEYQGMTPCPISETGVIDLVFLFKPGIGDHAIKIAEADANSFFHNADPDKRLLLTGVQTLETFNEPRWYRVVVGVEYRFTHGVLPNPNFVPKVLIKYDMETMDTLQSKARVMRNIADVGVHSGTFAGCNVIKPSLGTDVSIDYPNIHTLGSELATPNNDMPLAGGVDTIVTQLGNGEINVVVSSTANIQTNRPSINMRNVFPMLEAHKSYIIEYDMIVNSGTVTKVVFFTGIETIPYLETETYANGVNSESIVVSTSVDGTVNTLTFFNSYDINNRIFDVNFKFKSIKEVTVSSTTYNCYLDIATQKFVQSDKDGVAGPELSTPINISDFNMYGDNTVTETADEFTIHVNTGSTQGGYISKFGLTDIPPESSFFQVNSDTAYPGLTVQFGSNSKGWFNGLPNTKVFCPPYTSLKDTSFRLVNGVAGQSYTFKKQFNISEITNKLPVSTTYTMRADHQLFMTMNQALTTADLAALDTSPNLIFEVFFNSAVLPSGFARANIVNFAGANEGIKGLEKVYELTDATGATFYPIKNYEAAVREDDGIIGATNLFVMRDPLAGRTIATTPDKMVTFPITPDAPFTIPTDYTIDEVVQLDNGDYHHYIYTGEGKLYTDGLLTGSFTKPTGDWVLDDKTFDKAHTIKLRGAAIFRNYAFDKVSQVRSAYLEAKILYPAIP